MIFFLEIMSCKTEKNRIPVSTFIITYQLMGPIQKCSTRKSLKNVNHALKGQTSSSFEYLSFIPEDSHWRLGGCTIKYYYHQSRQQTIKQITEIGNFSTDNLGLIKKNKKNQESASILEITNESGLQFFLWISWRCNHLVGTNPNAIGTSFVASLKWHVLHGSPVYNQIIRFSLHCDPFTKSKTRKHT